MTRIKIDLLNLNQITVTLALVSSRAQETRVLITTSFNNLYYIFLKHFAFEHFYRQRLPNYNTRFVLFSFFNFTLSENHQFESKIRFLTSLYLKINSLKKRRKNAPSES